jgi:O-antigen/teichoic acid export membrane protein
MKLKIKLNEGITAMLSLTMVNALNYGLNIILGRWLGPDLYAGANILATLVLILSFIGVSIQMFITSEIAPLKTKEETPFMFHYLNGKVFKLSLFLLIISVGSSFAIFKYLNFSQPYEIVILAIGIPFYFLLSSKRGYFQGLQDFKSFANTFIIECFSRIIITVIGIYYALSFAPNHILIFISLGFLISFIVPVVINKIKNPPYSKALKPDVDWNKVLIFILAISFYELSQILINNFDVILVKHYFDNKEAGLYSAVAMVGRIVYFGTWTVVTILFPKVIEKEKLGENHLGLLKSAFLLVMLFGTSITLFAYFNGEFIISLLFGNLFHDASSLLWKYAAATSIFACANVIVYYFMSLKKYVPIFFSLLFGCLQILGIMQYHSNVDQIIMVQLICMSSLFIWLLLYLFGNSIFPYTGISWRLFLNKLKFLRGISFYSK